MVVQKGDGGEGTASPAFRSDRVQHHVGKIPAEELRHRAARYRLLARECVYPEGVDLLLLMADVHEDEATAAARVEAEAPFIAAPVLHSSR